VVTKHVSPSSGLTYSIFHHEFILILSAIPTSARIVPAITRKLTTGKGIPDTGVVDSEKVEADEFGVR
jgi:hypothetical protein